MDREKIKQLGEVVLKVRSDINSDLRQAVLQLRGNDWEQAPKLIEDCLYISDELRKAEVALAETRQHVVEMNMAIGAMYKEWQRTQAITVPSKIGDYVRVVIDEFLAGEAKLLKVDEVREKLEAQKVPLYFKNPAAVLASIIARDGRLERRGMGLFKKKANKAS